jgi:hypothetical protein
MLGVGSDAQFAKINEAAKKTNSGLLVICLSSVLVVSALASNAA